MPLDDAQPCAAEADLGPRPNLEWLPLDRLMVDPAYQRDADSRRSAALIERIGKAFSWRKFQPPTVAPRADGTYAIADGQHRVGGARRRGLTQLPCYIIAADDVQAEAASFTAINRDRVAMNSLQLHHSQLAARDPEAVQVQAVCEEAGITVARRPLPVDEMPPLQTQAVRTIARALRECRKEAPVVDALKLLAEAYPDVGGQITAGAIKGLVHFFLWHEAREIDWGRLVTVVRNQDMGDLEAAALASKALFAGKAHMALSAAITRAYNKGMRDQTRRLPEQV